MSVRFHRISAKERIEPAPDAEISTPKPRVPSPPPKGALTGPVTETPVVSNAPSTDVTGVRAADSVAAARWIEASAKPLTVLRTMPPPTAGDGSPRRSLRALFDLTKDKKVVGLGEAGHGLDVYGRLRNQLFAELVRHAGFRAITLESGIVEAAIVDRYVTGADDGPSIEEVLERGFTHGMGPFEETRELVEWVRDYNQVARREGRELVRFLGKDLPREGDTVTVPLEEVRAYLETVGADDAIAAVWPLAEVSAQVTNTVLDGIEAAGYPRVIDPDHLDFITSVSHDQLTDDERTKLADGVAELATFLAENRHRFVDGGVASAEAHDWAARMVAVAQQLLADLASRRQHPSDPQATDALRVMERVYTAKGAPMPVVDPRRIGCFDDPRSIEDNFVGRESRERHLAENVVAIAQAHGKTLNFAHNSHLARGPCGTRIGGELVEGANEGMFIADALGDDYLVVACTHDGSTAPTGSIEAMLGAAAGEGAAVLDLKSPDAVKSWLDAETVGRHADTFQPIVPGRCYDAIVYAPRAHDAQRLGDRITSAPVQPAKAIRRAIGRGTVTVDKVELAAAVVEDAGHSLEALTAFTDILVRAYERGRMPSDARDAFRDGVRRLFRDAHALALTPSVCDKSVPELERVVARTGRLVSRRKKEVASLEAQLTATVEHITKAEAAAAKLIDEKKALLRSTETSKDRTQVTTVAKSMFGLVPGVKLAGLAAVIPGLQPLALLALGYGGYQAKKGWDKANELSQEVDALAKKIKAATAQLADMRNARRRFSDNLDVLRAGLDAIREVEAEIVAQPTDGTSPQHTLAVHMRRNELLAYNLYQQSGVLNAMNEQASELDDHLGQLVDALRSEVELVERTSRSSEADFLTAVLSTVLPAAGIKGIGAELIREAVLYAKVGPEVTTIDKVRRVIERLGVDEAEHPTVCADAAKIIDGVDRLIRHRATILDPAFDEAVAQLTEPQRFLIDVALSKLNTKVDPATMIALARQTEVDDETARRIARMVTGKGDADEALALLEAQRAP